MQKNKKAIINLLQSVEKYLNKRNWQAASLVMNIRVPNVCIHLTLFLYSNLFIYTI